MCDTLSGQRRNDGERTQNAEELLINVVATQDVTVMTTEQHSDAKSISFILLARVNVNAMNESFTARFVSEVCMYIALSHAT